jgi:hypothetical protein
MTQAITDALDYVTAQDVAIPADVWALVIRNRALKATGDLAAINAQYHDAVTESLITYLEGGSLAASKNSFKRAMIEAFGGAWDAGWDGKPPTGEALEWFNARTQQELAFIDGLFVQAKELRKDPEADTFAWATARADGYTATVGNVYDHARIRALGNKMLTFDGEDGSPDNICQRNHGTCVQLKGQRHRASWWIAHDLVPYQGNAAYDCGAWECRHFLRDDDGNRVTSGGGPAVKHASPIHPGTGTGQQAHAGGVPMGADISFGRTTGTATAQALGDRIVVNKERYSELTEPGKRNLIAHELAHNLVEDKLLKDNAEWDRANDALLIRTIEKDKNVYFLYMLGESRIGEAMVSTIAAYALNEARPSGWTVEQWDKAMNWASHALNYGGFTRDSFRGIVDAAKERLDSQL